MLLNSTQISQLIQTVWSYCSHNTGLQNYAVVLANICEQAMHMYRNNFKGTGYTL